MSSTFAIDIWLFFYLFFAFFYEYNLWKKMFFWMLKIWKIRFSSQNDGKFFKFSVFCCFTCPTLIEKTISKILCFFILYFFWATFTKVFLTYWYFLLILFQFLLSYTYGKSIDFTLSETFFCFLVKCVYYFYWTFVLNEQKINDISLLRKILNLKYQ